MSYDYDAVIVGAGPGGATTALYADRLGLNVLLVDKKTFPRDKICGDAISGKSMAYLEELGLMEDLEAVPQEYVDSIIFSSPNHHSVKVKLLPTAEHGFSKGYVCRRMVFDNLLFEKARDKVETMEGFTVKDVIKPNGQVQGVRGVTKDGQEKEIKARVVIGADGANSIITRKLGLYKHEPEHVLVATRAYYRGVTEMTNAIELHYIEAVSPGYFWIFPLDNGLVNVGLGMVHKSIKKRNIRLRYAHEEAIESEFFKERFKNAELIGDIQGWNLPVGSMRRQVHGDGFLLLGDAAGLIDPFTGEGIGNAMASGKMAAETVAAVRDGNDYSAAALKQYQTQLWKRLGGELNLAYNLQKVGRFHPLVNLVVKKAGQKPEISNWISEMIAGKISKRDLLSPMTYVKLLMQ